MNQRIQETQQMKTMTKIKTNKPDKSIMDKIVKDRMTIVQGNKIVKK